MGTSNAYGGPGSGTPLLPSWLGPDGGPPPPVPEPPADNGAGNGGPAPIPTPPIFPAIPVAAPGDRFRVARNNFTRFASSGGSDRASLGRSVSNYVSTASGGSRTAAQRMGASRTSGARLLGFLSGAVANGSVVALRALNLAHLAGRPIEEVFLGLMEYVCPEGGTVDEGIAREAFIETIADLAQNEIVDIDGLTADQMQTIFELYASHAIEARLCNDIGTKSITVPADPADAARVQTQLFDFVRRSVADALTSTREAMLALTPERVTGFVTRIYEQAFSILQSLGDEEADAR
ncbi:MAG: Qat anti-phage system associated protein QatB [Bryobacteraceae bacterium]